MAQNPIVTMTMNSGNSVKIELYPDVAKNTVNNFKIMSVSYISRMELTRENVAATAAEHAKHDASLNQAAGMDARRNALCPCGSGQKFKHCCGKLH